MNLGFKTDIDGKPTYFVDRILSGLTEENHIAVSDYNIHFDRKRPKIHTIKEGNRWKPGMMIDFWVNMRTKNQLRFAPRIPVVSVQEIRIRYRHPDDDVPDIYVDGMDMWKVQSVGELAMNDGFERIVNFLEVFDTDFKGQIINWTDFKY